MHERTCYTIHCKTRTLKINGMVRPEEGEIAVERYFTDAVYARRVMGRPPELELEKTLRTYLYFAADTGGAGRRSGCIGMARGLPLTASGQDRSISRRSSPWTK